MTSTGPEPPASDLAELRAILLEIGFSERDFTTHVSLGADRDMFFCVLKAPGGGWDVFYTERGSRSPQARVSTTRGAAFVLLGMIGRGDLIEAVRRSAANGNLG